MITTAPDRRETGAGLDSLADVVRAEWTKFRTVRGWVIGMTVAALVTVLLGLLAAEGSTFSCATPTGVCHIVYPVGPGGESVSDSFYFVHQPLASHGSITARITSLTGELPLPSANGHIHVGHGASSDLRPGLEPWSKAGIIIKASTRQGSAYAAMLVTGTHGVRMQYDYTGDVAGLPGAATAASPRWLRLTRSGATVTGYDSADGRHWAKVGTVVLPGLPSTAQAGLFATSPAYTSFAASGAIGASEVGGPTLATGVLDRVSLRGGLPGHAWAGTQLGGGPSGAYPAQGGGYHQAGGRFRVTGSGDIAPEVPGGPGSGQDIAQTLVGVFAGLVAVVVVGTMFVTAEYRRGLIRTTFAASPRRGRVLAAKAMILGGVTFVATLLAAAVAVAVNGHVLRAHGSYLYPVPALTEVRLVVGSAAFLAVAAVLALAIGAALRRSAVAVTVVILAIVLPYLASVTNLLSNGGSQWLLRVAPAAAFAMDQTIPNYPQVSNVCSAAGGCYPLAWWAGFAVLCAWAAAALALAAFLLRRRDA